ncbi:unnamed protein product [Linum tenue]|uniref:Uncharacterized protein n=1 Tax=Linum tenue TaxID=586396 RepID=A0AAV0QHB1_9ROSI|nr:unnamed protein product [Linum tenue]
MADHSSSGAKPKFTTLVAVLFPMLCYCLPLFQIMSNQHHSPPPPQIKPHEIAAALRSHGNYSSSCSDLEAKLSRHLASSPAGGFYTVFVPSDDSTYDRRWFEKPEVQIVTSRVDRRSFGSGRLSAGSVLRGVGGGEERAILVAELPGGGEYYPRLEFGGRVRDWNLYDDGRVVVHGFAGKRMSHWPPVAVGVGGLGISGLVAPRERRPAREFPVRRVDGLETLELLDDQPRVLNPRGMIPSY